MAVEGKGRQAVERKKRQEKTTTDKQKQVKGPSHTREPKHEQPHEFLKAPSHTREHQEETAKGRRRRARHTPQKPRGPCRLRAVRTCTEEP